MDTVTIIFETRGYLEFAFKPSKTRRDGRVERLVTRMRLFVGCVICDYDCGFFFSHVLIDYMMILAIFGKF